ncbi:MAG: hypothetical protein Q8O57_09600, partial [Kiritimatiellota bacterium]|nr:hypothetical protein [Kiritimatiellota bacterium]
GRPIKDAMLLYTTNRGRWQDRKWSSASARMIAGYVRAELPEDVAVCYLAIEDDHGAYASSPHLEIEGGRAKPSNSGSTCPRA